MSSFSPFLPNDPTTSTSMRSCSLSSVRASQVLWPGPFSLLYQTQSTCKVGSATASVYPRCGALAPAWLIHRHSHLQDGQLACFASHRQSVCTATACISDCPAPSTCREHDMPSVCLQQRSGLDQKTAKQCRKQADCHKTQHEAGTCWLPPVQQPALHMRWLTLSSCANTSNWWRRCSGVR